jgi:eukaryotic-like serine/threonine-protein kinase
LKPSNILIDADGEPCIADFGLAKIQESDAGLTQEQSVLGSPSYMAPEQAAGKGGEVTTAADVYSLGAILYELLTGTPPFLGKTPLETLRQVIEQPPLPPRKRVPELSRDLESICLKALEKEPARRYASALELAEDLDRWRNGEPVRARPVKPWEHAWRWCRRRPALAALIVVSVISLVTLAIGSTLAARSLKVAGDETRQLVRRLQHERAESYLDDGNTAKGLAMLAYLLRENPADEVAGTRLVSALSQRSLAVPMVRPWVVTSEVLAVSFTGDGRFSSAIARNGAFRRLELATARTWDALLARPDEALTFALLHAEGAVAATAHPDGALKLWRTAEPLAPLAELRNDSPLKSAVFSPDARSILTLDQQNIVRWWRPATEGPTAGMDLVMPAGQDWTATALALPAGETINLMRFDPGGSQFAVGAESGKVQLFATTAGEPQPRRLTMEGGVRELAFDPAGRRLAVASSWNKVWVWSLGDLHTPLREFTLEAACTDLEFSPDGRFLAAAGWSPHNRAFVWDTSTGEPMAPALRHQGNVTGVRFSPDGRELITLGHDYTARRWKVEGWVPLGEPLVHVSAPLQVAFEATGRHLVTGSYSGAVWWNLSAPVGKPARLEHAARVTRAAFAPDGRTLATGTSAGQLHMWNLSDHSPHVALSAQPDAVLHLRHDYSGRRLLTFGLEGTVRFWDAATGAALARPIRHPTSIYSAVFSADDRRLLTAGTDGNARLWDIETGELVLPEMRHGAPLRGALFDPAGTRILTYGQNHEARWWSVATGRPAGAPLLHGAWVEHVEFSSDGRWLVTAGQDPRVRLWNTTTGESAGVPLQHQNAVLMATFSPDANWLASASTDTTVQVVRLSPGNAPVVIPHGAALRHIAFSPDSRQVLTLARDGVIRVWDPATGLPVTDPLRTEPAAQGAQFNVDGSAVLVLGSGHEALLWSLPRYDVGSGLKLATVAELVGRMRLESANRFQVSPVNDWTLLPEPLDLRRELGLPASPR